MTRVNMWHTFLIFILQQKVPAIYIDDSFESTIYNIRPLYDNRDKEYKLNGVVKFSASLVS